MSSTIRTTGCAAGIGGQALGCLHHMTPLGKAPGCLLLEGKPDYNAMASCFLGNCQLASPCDVAIIHPDNLKAKALSPR